mmetsp:Transcript_43457/g.113120  ORF Transcript_43457/g.113120 Transcript_43457/m.113120 type:complete len:208 (+) Transcript_43457:213-836(+)|eukprot:CAMPEP_0113889254 /NCGR_PEP_ID=MMETSP0780_2-20120614/13375_1 /TAXON_ID=652834 /ORGANISM="Palpitomonas bilix" /LENGTH=207 /DNA_ID=CAMNT_0000878293 /DNA_START=150 /DNA_END=770 /DNA_ORIENTATION=- /assembly_acc=CAM_ASM_000599
MSSHPSKKTRILPTPGQSGIDSFEQAGKVITVLIIGLTGSGKSTFVESLLRSRLQLPALDSCNSSLVSAKPLPFRDCKLVLVEVAGCKEGRLKWASQAFDGVVYVVNEAMKREAPFARRVLDEFVRNTGMAESSKPLAIAISTAKAGSSTAEMERIFERSGGGCPCRLFPISPPSDPSNASPLSWIYDAVSQAERERGKEGRREEVW